MKLILATLFFTLSATLLMAGEKEINPRVVTPDCWQIIDDELHPHRSKHMPASATSLAEHAQISQKAFQDTYELPGLIEDAFEEAMRLWKGRYPNEKQKEAFRNWYYRLRFRIEEPDAAQVLRDVFEQNLREAPYPLPRGNNLDRFRKLSEFILLCWRMKKIAPNDTYGKDSARQAIKNIGPLANSRPEDIHLRLMEKGWTSPNVEYYRRIFYFWFDANFEEVAIIRLDQANRGDYPHAHKEAMAISTLYPKVRDEQLLIYDPFKAEGIQIFDDDGEPSAKVVQIPLDAIPYPPELRTRTVNRLDPPAMRPYFFPRLLELIGDRK